MNDTFQNVRAGGRAYLVEEQPNPSTDYYVQPALTRAGLHVVKCGFRELPSPGELDGAVLVFVRYVPSSWRRLVDAVRPRLAALVFFMDDDVLDPQASVGMPWHYRLKLARLAAWKVDWLRGQGAELWVSVPYLKQKYSGWNPRLVLPSRIPSPLNGCRVFYHGSSTHRAEVYWLRPVIEEVLRRDERISFEIVGGREVFKLYRGLRSVTTVHPMKWPAYQDFIATGGRHIGLAPLLDVAFNQARSYTKFLDFTRCGAVGIYSTDSAYAEVVEHGTNGLLAPLAEQAWVDAILTLAGDEMSRASMLRNAERTVAARDDMARSGYADLLSGRGDGRGVVPSPGTAVRQDGSRAEQTPPADERRSAPWIAMSRTVADMPVLEELLGAPVVYHRAARGLPKCRGVIAWGRKPSAGAAVDFAARHGLGLLRLEDGFLRSVELGRREAPLSIVVDEVGIYYDAAAPSRLEMEVVAAHTPAQLARASSLVLAWRAARVSKYNHAREYAGDLSGRYVLVVDQVRGDASIHHGGADESSFQRMAAAALSEYPDCEVWIKAPPAVVAGHGRGHLTRSALKEEPRIKWLTTDIHPASLIEHAQAIYVVTSQLGFEGLLWGRRVRVFGMPFYAGWGLTDDELPPPLRRKAVSLESLAHAALIDYPRYIDPETGKRCEVERVLEWMALQLRMRARFPRIVYARGFSLYKRPIVRSFFQGSEVRFVRSAHHLPRGAVLAVWGREDGGALPAGVTLIRLEDGFIRSVGLGADLVRPLSWVMDSVGIYYDATAPSALEHILNAAPFDEELLARARLLQERLVSGGVTKYNVGSAAWVRPGDVARKVILVPGQVESDASLAFGALGMHQNLELLRAVRERNPLAYVIYKPHPDVVAGLRRAGDGEGEAASFCDEVLTSVGMGELLPLVDEVHTLTSLTGFEALLRGKAVVCYGLPFYAGWGLTTDILPIERRTRRLSLAQLVAGALILYPSYVSGVTGRFTTPERVLDELVLRRANMASAIPWWGRAYRFITKRILRRR